jgi:hypothetical protein
MPWQRKFKNAQEIYDAAKAYMEHLEDKPLTKTIYVGKDGREETERLKRIPTWQGFAVFTGVSSAYFRELKRTRGARSEDEHAEILSVLMHVSDLFYADKAEAASAGLANPSFIMHELGMKRQEDQLEANISNGQLVIKVVPPKTDDEE